MALKSFIFAKDPVFEKCLVDHAAHIVPGARGPHIRKLQGALEAIDGFAVDDREWETSTFGPVTAKAVLEFKIARDIVNRSYQQKADNIVGKMTIARLDEEMAAIEVDAKAGGGSRCECGSEPNVSRLQALALNSRLKNFKPVAIKPTFLAEAALTRNSVAARTSSLAKPALVGAAPRPVRIEKVGSAPTFGSDGFDDIARFQMVPLRFTRHFTATSSSVPCTIEIESGKDLARFINIRDRDGKLLEPDASKVVTVISLPPNTFVAFSLLGLKAGLGQVVVRTNGKVDSSLMFSVKEPQSKSVAVWLVSDNRSRSTSMTAERAPKLLKASSDFFLAWTNTSFTMLGKPTPIVVPRDLGDPIDMQKGSGNQNRIAENHVWPLKANGVQADIHLFYTWDLKDYSDRQNEMFGITGGPFCFVESTENMPEQVNLSQTTAHEIGHALGLDHNSRRDSLMHEDTFHMLSRLQMHEINTVNPSGTNP